jgi:raffinose/stachyose/melibiose transport system substrate-binding protein
MPTPPAAGRRLRRRRFLTLLGGAAAAPAAAACAGPGTRTVQPGEGSLSDPPEGRLSFVHWRAEDNKALEQTIARFRARTPKVTVRQDIAPSMDYQTTALMRIKSGAIGDVFTAFPGSQFVNMAKAGLYTDLTGAGLAEGYREEYLAAGRRDGRQLGLPYQLVFNTPVANLDLLEKAGASEAPKDWDGYLALCEDLKALGVAPLAWPGGQASDAGQLLGTMVMNNAPTSRMFADIEAGRRKVTDDWFLTTLRQYAQLREFMQPNATGTAVEPAQQLFARGKAAMLATGSFHLLAARKLGAKFPVDLLAPITVGRERARYEGVHNATFILGVNRASDHRSAALAFVRHLSRADVAQRLAQQTTQHVTVRGVRYEHPDLRALQPWLSRKTLASPRYQLNDLDIRNAIENAATRVVGGASPEQAAEEAQRIVDQQL